MQVLVTGGAGFIGSHLVDAFAARGDDVTVIDDLSAGREARLHPAARFIKGSITGPGIFREAGSPDLICHLAAQVDVRRSVAQPAADAAVNVLGTINVLEAARAAGARVIFASTGGAIYGSRAPVPTPEAAATEPESPYGTSKLCAEQYVGLYNRLHRARHSVLRFGNVYGPRQNPDGEGGVIAIFCGKVAKGEPVTVFGDGTQTRDYVYVGDVVAAFLRAAGSEDAGTWNVGTETETSVLDLLGMLRRHGKVTPVFAPPRAGELMCSVLDAGRIRAQLGWKAETTVPEGVSRVYAWVRQGSPDR